MLTKNVMIKFIYLYINDKIHLTQTNAFETVVKYITNHNFKNPRNCCFIIKKKIVFFYLNKNCSIYLSNARKVIIMNV